MRPDDRPGRQTILGLPQTVFILGVVSLLTDASRKKGTEQEKGDRFIFLIIRATPLLTVSATDICVTGTVPASCHRRSEIRFSMIVSHRPRGQT